MKHDDLGAPSQVEINDYQERFGRAQLEIVRAQAAVAQAQQTLAEAQLTHAKAQAAIAKLSITGTELNQRAQFAAQAQQKLAIAGAMPGLRST